MTVEEPESRVLKWIKPREEDRNRAQEVFSEIKERLKRTIDKLYSDFEILLEGSMAKDTWLRNSPEMDVFIVFSEELSKDELKKVVEVIAKENIDLSPRISYAEHPYVTLEKGPYSIDVVPAIKMRGDSRPRTAVDRTPLHTKFVVEHTDEALRDEIRIAKAFLKGIGVYGAEIGVGGFSGYLAELLVIRMGGFRELLRASEKWRAPLMLGFTDDDEVFKELKKRYPNSAMLFPDPVDPGRNVAAALTKKKMAEFVLASMMYLSSPSLYYFSERNEEIALAAFDDLPFDLYSEHTVVIDITLKEQLHPDVLWGGLKKAASSIKKTLERNDFSVVSCESWTNERDRAAVACMTEEKILEPIYLMRGPPFFLRENAEKFINKYIGALASGPWIDEDGRLNSINVRRRRSPIQIVEESLSLLLPRDLLKGSIKVYRATRDRLLSSDDIGKWLRIFCMNKPKWVLPAYLKNIKGEPSEEELFSKE